MRLLKITILLLFTSPFLYGQQIPFQGRLLENGNPVTGQRNFAFSINIGAVNWSETQNNVVVTNGLYALVLGQNTPLPTNLFASQNSVPLTIQVDGQSLPTTTLYASFESDPTVPESLKDGVSWEEISNKPTLDASTTNEIQILEINDREVSISNGNTITLPSFNNPTEDFAVGTQGTVNSCAVEQLAFDGSVTLNSLWQSFLTIEDAKLEEIQVNFANLTGIDIRLRIYEGEGTVTQAIYDVGYNSNDFSPSLTIQSFNISNNSNINLTSGNTYTFFIQGVGDDLTFRRNNNNPYPVGRSSINASTDAIFKINVSQTQDYTFEVTPDFTTVNTPLIINDRVEDKTGFIMPVGAIIPYGGATPPKGWLLCDGGGASTELYPDLFAAIGYAWGGSGNIFNLPDLRGRFLRGVSADTNNDPNKATRVAFYPGGNVGNNVGSYQLDEYGRHNHVATLFNDGPTVSSATSGTTASGRSFPTEFRTNSVLMTGNAGGDETRPRNAYVTYIIKY